MAHEKQIHGEDIEIRQLVPLNTREINLAKNRGYQKIISTFYIDYFLKRNFT